jgi:NADPH:quinone reductase-like Zn-dependent oxidoreductase
VDCELVIDSRSLSFSDEIGEHTNGRGVDVILNSFPYSALNSGFIVELLSNDFLIPDCGKAGG